MQITAKLISKELKSLANPKIAEHSKRFFKTGKGEYGYGDKFLGIRVPVLRKLVRSYLCIELQQIQHLLESIYHEERLFALLLLVEKFQRGSQKEQKSIYKLYLDNTANINNWDLVDCSAHKIVGPYLADKKRLVLYKLCKSESLWERRIAIISTYYFIKLNDFEDALNLSSALLNDKHDLIHKAVGWMLREIGNRDLATEKAFLKPHYKAMPRTTLRYAIEKFPEVDRKKYLLGEV